MSTSVGSHCPACGQPKYPAAVAPPDVAQARLAEPFRWAHVLEELWPIIEPRLTELLGRFIAKL